MSEKTAYVQNTPKKPSLHPVDSLRVRFWYQGLKRATKCTTAYQLERYFEPLDKVVDGRTPFRNKWIRYEHGQHVPQAKLVEMVEVKCPGGAVDLHHALWKALKLGGYIPSEAERLFASLEPQVKLIIYMQQTEKVLITTSRSKFKSAFIPRLLKLGNIDALTALLLYWREAVNANQRSDAILIAKSIYSLLLILGAEIRRREVIFDVFDIFRQAVFVQTEWNDGLFAIDEKIFSCSTFTLESLLRKVPKLKPFDSWHSRCKAMHKLLSGQFGLDVLFGLGVVLLPNWHYGPPTRNQFNSWLSQWKDWLWGWKHLEQGTQGMIPNDELWYRIDQQYPEYRLPKSDISI